MLPILLFLAALIPLDESGFSKLVAEHKGKVTAYAFWATWCAPCRAEMPAMLSLQAKFKARGFDLVLISADEPEQEAQAVSVLRKNGAPDKSYRKQARNDEAFINAIDRQWSGALPAIFLFDRQGKKVRSFIGETDSGAIEPAILKIL